MEIKYKNYTIKIEEDGKPLRDDLKPLEVAQGQWVKLLIYKDSNFKAEADKFGYRVNGMNFPSLATPFTNMQRYIESVENPIKSETI
jgi:hypothetical protein